MKKTFLLILSLLSITLSAQVDKGPDIEIKAMTKGDVYQCDLEANFNFFKYLSIGLGLGGQSNFKQSYGGYLPNNKSVEWDVDDDDEKMDNITLRPSFRLRTPYLKIAKNQMAFYTTPGLIIYPFSGDQVDIRFTKPNPNKLYQYESWIKSYNTPYLPIRLYWEIQYGIEYRIDDYAFIGGYETSNQDFYTSRRKLTFEGVVFNKKLPDRRSQMQGVFIGLRYYP